MLLITQINLVFSCIVCPLELRSTHETLKADWEMGFLTAKFASVFGGLQRDKKDAKLTVSMRYLFVEAMQDL